jgi:hypothetical protein
MRWIRPMRVPAALILFGMAIPVFGQAAAAQPEAILHPSDMTRILPGQVFFRGQSATTQLRNSGGVRFADGAMLLVALVDNSGYSSGLQQKYQAYLITEAPLDFGGHRLVPGAYGAGIVGTGTDLKFVVMNLAAKDVFQTAAAHDAKLHRPVPLEVLAGSEAGTYRLYLGRNYVEFERAK